MFRNIIFLYVLVISDYVFSQGQCPNNLYNTKQPAGKSTCLFWGRYNVKTFDDNAINYQSRCTFTLASFKVGTTDFKIDAGLSPACKDKPECHTVVGFLYDGKHYALDIGNQQEATFTSGTETYQIPSEFDGIRIHQPSTRVVVEFLNTGIEVIWNEKNLIEINIDNNLGYKVLGLCGNKDKCSSNDQLLTSGSPTSDIRKFLDDWQADKASCFTPITIDNPCKTKFQISQSMQACQVITTPVFKAAQKVVPPAPFMMACVHDFCSCTKKEKKDCVCDSLDAYVKASVNAGGGRVFWRNANRCPLPCIGDLKYLPCAPPGGPKTCTDTTAVALPAKCEEGCYCAQTYFHEGKCYPKKNCPCKYLGRTIQAGDTVQQKCHTCTCTEGKIVCPKIPPCFVTATVFGDPHYVTWDGKRYDFMGKCAYYLVKGNDFSIVADHQIWRNGQFVKDERAGGVSYTREVIVTMDGEVVHLKPDLVVLVNNVKVNRFPHKAGAISITKPHGHNILVELPNWVQVEWNGYSTATIRLPTDMEGQVEGLMGTYTENASDDFLTPNGDIAADPVTFGNSWKTDETCGDEPIQPVQHPCDANPSVRPTAEKVCSVIKSGIFKDCETDLDTVYENCLYDACVCKDTPAKCACDAINVAAGGCAQKGIATNWRDRVQECKLPCPVGQVYQECADACSGSCEDISIRPVCTKNCISGCSCSPGSTLDENGKCVPIGQCKCRIDGSVFPAGFQYREQNEVRTCRDAKWAITEATDVDLQQIPDKDTLNAKCDVNSFSAYTPCRYPTPKSCQNMHIFEITSIENCQEGCECIDGYVFDAISQKCVKPEQCQCLEKGQSHQEGGVVVREGCNRCVCTNRNWLCQKENCDDLCNENEIKKIDCNTCKCKNAFWTCTNHDCSQQCPTEGAIRKVDCNTCACTNGFWACTKKQCVKECQPQDVRVEGCKTCVCNNGQWSCNEDSCVPSSCPTEGEVRVYKTGKCVCKGNEWKCPKSQCDLWGDSHVKTFDGVQFDFQGECTYTLLEANLGFKGFSVSFENGRCSHAGATCLKSFTVFVSSHGVPKEAVTFTRKGPLPNPDGYKNLILTDHHLYFTIEIVGTGAEVFWDKNTWVYVKINDQWLQKTRGLCGNFNRVPDDDLRTPNGNKVLEFVDQFRARAECADAKPNTDACDPVRRRWAEDQCKVLLSPTFAPCHSTVSVDSFYEACVTDSCKCDLGGDCECLCSAIAIYAQQCNKYGYSIEWRSQELCPLQCSKNTLYQPCITTCPQKTCDTIRRNLTSDCDEEICSEGCGPEPPPRGNVYTDQKYENYVDEQTCFEQRCKDRFYEGEVMYKTKCKVCVCMAGKEQCVDLPCPNQYSTPATLEPPKGDNQDKTTRPTVVTPPDEKGKPTRPSVEPVTPTKPSPGGGEPGLTPTPNPNKTPTTPKEPIEEQPSTVPPIVVFPITTTAMPPTDKQCDKNKCPVLNCPSFTREVLDDDQCCKMCQHEKKCFIQMEYTKKFLLKKPGQVWMDGPCKECECVGENDYNHCKVCKKKLCATVKARNTTVGNIYYEFARGPCCLTMEPAACVYKNRVYRIGELWDVDQCSSMTCVKDPTTSLTFVQHLKTECNADCPVGYVYKKLPNVCCGYCVQDSCIYEGAAKKLGESWTSKDGCDTYTCTDVKGTYQVLSRKTECPPLFDCPGNVRQANCCKYCDTSELFVWEKEKNSCSANQVDQEGIPEPA